MKRDLTKVFFYETYTKSPFKNYVANKTIIKAIDDTYSMDIVDPNDYVPKNNGGFRHTLVVMDTFIKNGSTVPLRNKNAQSLNNCFENKLRILPAKTRFNRD